MTNANNKPIEWHDQCLANEKWHVEQLWQDMLRAESGYLKAKAEYEKYVQQIAKAKAEGRVGFDRNRFAKE